MSWIILAGGRCLLSVASASFSIIMSRRLSNSVYPAIRSRNTFISVMFVCCGHYRARHDTVCRGIFVLMTSFPVKTFCLCLGNTQLVQFSRNKSRGGYQIVHVKPFEVLTSSFNNAVWSRSWTVDWKYFAVTARQIFEQLSAINKRRRAVIVGRGYEQTLVVYVALNGCFDDKYQWFILINISNARFFNKIEWL